MVGVIFGGLLAGCGDDGSGADTDGATSAASTGLTEQSTTNDPSVGTTGPQPGTSTTTANPTTTVDPTTGDPDSSEGGSSDTGAEVLASATILGLHDDTTTGTATFTQEGTEITLVIELQGVVPAGLHGIHIHENGDCSHHEGQSAGGHWNPYGNNHGMLGMGESHLGDLGNIEIDAGGSGTLVITTSEWSIGTGEIDDVVGKGFILHQDEDDLSTNPNPGARIACGAIALE